MIAKLFNKKNLIIVLCFSILFPLLGGSYTFLASYNRQGMTLTLNYTGSEKGYNPDGSKFNVYEMKSDEIISETLSRMDVDGLTTSFAKTRINIEAKSAKQSYTRVYSAVTNSRSSVYVPMEFTIWYSQKDKFAKNHTVELLRTLSEVYTEYFMEKYTQKNTVLDVSDLDLSKYDYSEIVTIYGDRIASMLTLLDSYKNESSTFRSTETGQTFVNLMDKLNNLRNVEIPKLDAYITTSGVSKDRFTFLNKLDYQRNAQEIRFNKAESSKNIILGAIDIYDAEITGSLFIPTVDKNKNLYMNKTKTGIDYLAQRAQTKGEESKNIRADLDRYTFLSSVYEQSNVTASSPQTRTAQEMTESINKQLVEIATIAQTTCDEYLSQKTNDYLSFSIPEDPLDSALSIRRLIRYGIMGFMFGCLAAIFLSTAVPHLLEEYRKIKKLPLVLKDSESGQNRKKDRKPKRYQCRHAKAPGGKGGMQK